jgi:hypothetical protein
LDVAKATYAWSINCIYFIYLQTISYI